MEMQWIPGMTNLWDFHGSSDIPDTVIRMLPPKCGLSCTTTHLKRRFVEDAIEAAFERKARENLHCNPSLTRSLMPIVYPAPDQTVVDSIFPTVSSFPDATVCSPIYRSPTSPLLKV
jgi:hypothetical protein